MKVGEGVRREAAVDVSSPRNLTVRSVVSL